MRTIEILTIIIFLLSYFAFMLGGASKNLFKLKKEAIFTIIAINAFVAGMCLMVVAFKQ